MDIKSIQLPSYSLNIVRAAKSMSLETRDMKTLLQPGQVLIRMAATPINPSDISFIQGRYNIRKLLPAIPGFEGTGTVIEAGADREALALLHKRVSCFVQEASWGTWADHFVAAAKDCIVVEEGLSDEQAACLSVNPFTAYGLMQSVVKRKCPSLLINAAGSQVAAFIRQMAGMNGMQVINIVRKPELARILREQGEAWVIEEQDEQFDNILEKMALELDTRIALDAVGGDMSGKILNRLPENSELLLYGGLSGKPTGNLDPLELIFRGKTLKGWNLYQWKEEAGEQGFWEASGKIQQWIMGGKLKTAIQGSYPLEEFETALFRYIKNMSGGKILLLP